MPIDTKTARAYSEVYEFLHHLGREYIDKLPQKLLELFDTYRDKSYNYKININVSGNNQFSDMSREAIALIAYLHLEYWATAEEREKLLKIFDRNEKKYKLQQYDLLLEEREDS